VNFLEASGFTAADALRWFAALRGDRQVVSGTLPVHPGIRDGQELLLLAPGAQSVLDALAGRGTLAPGASAAANPAPSATNPTAC
jgi:hypothetical protein